MDVSYGKECWLKTGYGQLMKNYQDPPARNSDWNCKLAAAAAELALYAPILTRLGVQKADALQERERVRTAAEVSTYSRTGSKKKPKTRLLK